MIQASNLEAGIMRCELSDDEWGSAPASRSGIAALSCALTRSHGHQFLPAPDAVRLAIACMKSAASGRAENATVWTTPPAAAIVQSLASLACSICAAGSGPSFARLDRCLIGRCAASVAFINWLRRSARSKKILLAILVQSTAILKGAFVRERQRANGRQR